MCPCTNFLSHNGAPAMWCTSNAEVKLFSGLLGILNILGGSFNYSTISVTTTKWKCGQFDRAVCFPSGVSIYSSPLLVQNLSCTIELNNSLLSIIWSSSEYSFLLKFCFLYYQYSQSKLQIGQFLVSFCFKIIIEKSFFEILSFSSQLHCISTFTIGFYPMNSSFVPSGILHYHLAW